MSPRHSAEQENGYSLSLSVLFWFYFYNQLWIDWACYLDASYNGGCKGRVVLSAEHSGIHQHKPATTRRYHISQKSTPVRAWNQISQCHYNPVHHRHTELHAHTLAEVSHVRAVPEKLVCIIQMFISGNGHNTAECAKNKDVHMLTCSLSYPMTHDRMNWLRKIASDQPSYSIAWGEESVGNKKC